MKYPLRSTELDANGKQTFHGNVVSKTNECQWKIKNFFFHGLYHLFTYFVTFQRDLNG